MSNQRKFEEKFLGEWPPPSEIVIASFELWCCYFFLMAELDQWQGSYPKNEYYYTRSNEIYTATMVVMSEAKVTYDECQAGKKNANRIDLVMRGATAQKSQYLQRVRDELRRDKIND